MTALTYLNNIWAGVESEDDDLERNKRDVPKDAST